MENEWETQMETPNNRSEGSSKEGGRCGERLRVKEEVGESLEHNSCSGGRGDLSRRSP
jgi:hypothetical protein